MALHLNKLPEFEYPKNAMLNFAPVTHALDFLGKQQVEEDRRKQQQQEIGIRRQQVGIQEGHLDLARQNQETQERERMMKELGGMAQVVEDEKEPQRRSQMWNEILRRNQNAAYALKRAGVDPGDHVNGPKFLMAQIGAYDPLKRRQAESGIELQGAHAEYYRNMGEVARERAGVQKQDADRRSFQAVAQYFGEKNPTEAEWNVLNQEGGILRTSFGRMVPFSQAPVILAQGRRANKASDDDMRAAGLSEDDIKDIKRRGILKEGLGTPKIGHSWEKDDAGRWFQKKLTEDDSKNTIPIPQLEMNYENVKDAFRLIAGRPGKGGRGLEGGANILERGLSAIPGGYVQPGLNEAYTAAEHAALQLSYALSGKTVGQAEQGRILAMFAPTRGESAERAGFKMNAMAQLYQRLLEAKRAGRTIAANEELFQSVMAEQARALRDHDKAANAPKPAGPGRTPSLKPPTAKPADDRVRTLYDKYGLE